jgi:hypothetical protein
MSVDGADTDEEHTIAMGATADLLQITTETRVLNPHLVAKCSQLDLVLVDFKFHDPNVFDTTYELRRAHLTGCWK